MSPLQHGLTPKMKPISPRRSAVICALDIGTSKVACLIARLKPCGAHEALRRRSHGVEVLGIGHTRARGIKSGTVVKLDEAEQSVRQAVDAAERMARVHVESVVLSVGAGRVGSELYAATVHIGGLAAADGDIERVLGRQATPFARFACDYAHAFPARRAPAAS